MGKWDRRPYRGRTNTRRRYQDYNWSPPRDEPCPDPETQEWDDNVPMWEKKFCYLVGKMSWKKVLSSSSFMHRQGYNNIISWDDSAGEDAFRTAKEHFWKEINGIPSETQLPDPDMYIDQIDWNPHIDPELVRELDRIYFHPDDKYYLPSERYVRRGNGWPDNPWDRSFTQSTAVEEKTTGWSPSVNGADDTERHKESDRKIGWNQGESRPDDGENNWGCGRVQTNAQKDKGIGLDQWGKDSIDVGKLTRDDDPWERCNEQPNVVKNSNWGNGDGWGLQSQSHSSTSKEWSSGNKLWRNEGKTWQYCGANSWGSSQRTGDFHKPNHQNNNYRPQINGSSQGARVTNDRVNSWGANRNNYRESRDSGISKSSGQFSTSYRKREGPGQYAAIHKGPRIQGADSYSSRHWSDTNNKRVGFGGQWS